IGFFPVDNQTLDYLRLTGRDAGQVDLVERYSKEQGLWRSSKSEPVFSEYLELDLASIAPCVAGPRRPQDRIELRGVKQNFESALVDIFKKHAGQAGTPRLDRWAAEGPVASHETGEDADAKSAATTEHLTPAKQESLVTLGNPWANMTHGDIVIAAITS